MFKLSATVAASAFSQLGSSDTFCAVISRFVSERCAAVSVSSRCFLLEHCFSHDFLEPACLRFVVATSFDWIAQFFRTSRYPCAQAVSELASASTRGPSRGMGTRVDPFSSTKGWPSSSIFQDPNPADHSLCPTMFCGNGSGLTRMTW